MHSSVLQIFFGAKMSLAVRCLHFKTCPRLPSSVHKHCVDDLKMIIMILLQTMASPQSSQPQKELTPGCPDVEASFSRPLELGARLRPSVIYPWCGHVRKTHRVMFFIQF